MGVDANAQGGSSIDPWFWQSIVVTILCCVPFGVVGIVKSSQAKSAIDAGDHARATTLAAEAKRWSLIGVGVGLVVNIGLGIFYFGGLAAMA